MIQACPDEPLVNGKEGVSRKNRNFLSVCLYVVKKVDGLRDGGTSKFPAGTQMHTTGHSSESSAQELKIFESNPKSLRCVNK